MFLQRRAHPKTRARLQPIARPTADFCVARTAWRNFQMAGQSFGAGVRMRSVTGRQRFAPFFAAPAEFKRGIFEPVNFGFVNAGESGLERGKPVVVRPVESDRAQRAAGKFSEWVMGDGFAAIQEKRDTITTKPARQRFVIIVKVPHQHGAVAEPRASPDKFQNFARGKDGLGLGTCTSDHRNCGLRFARARLRSLERGIRSN